MWGTEIAELTTHSLNRQSMANVHRMIKASPFSNMELFAGLASVLTSWSVSAGEHGNCNVRFSGQHWSKDFPLQSTVEYLSVLVFVLAA